MAIRLIISSAVLLFASAPAFAAPAIFEECHGTETVRIGNSEPTSAPYTVTFRADLSTNTYCYGPCTKDQTFPIADAGSTPMKLADLEKDGQVRHLTFDQASNRLTDFQIFNAGLGVVTRRVTAICQPGKP